MDFSNTYAVFGGIQYRFASLAEHMQTGKQVVVCSDKDGTQKCIEASIWEQAVTTARQANPEYAAASMQSASPIDNTEDEIQHQLAHPTATTHSSNAEKLAVYRWLFRGREDVYAKAYFSKRHQKIGYTPACANEWEKPLCGKPRVRCANCEYRVFLPLDDEVVLSHLRGRATDCTDVIGMYPLTPDEEVFFLAADFDKGAWASEALAYIKAGQDLGVPAYLERSRSGNGGHVWIFFEQATPASTARRLGCLLVSHAMEKHHPLPFSAYDRFFPNQDGIAKDGFGNLIALPLQGKAVQKGNSVFVDDSLVAYPDQWAFLSSVKKVGVSTIEKLIGQSKRPELGTLVSSESKPWEQKSPQTLSPLDFVEMPTVVEADMLYVSKEGLSANAVDRIRRLAAFANRDFYRAQAMKQSVSRIPRIIYAGNDSDDYIGLPRGCKKALSELLDAGQTSFIIQDERSEGKPIDARFTGKLRPEQERAANALLPLDTGILAATPSFGKTVVSAYLIAERKVSTLILVPSTTLLEQWRERLETFLEINEELPELLTKTGRKSRVKRSVIGQIGGGKNLPSGIVDVAIPASLFEKTDIPGERRVRDIVSSYGMVICDECHHVPADNYLQVINSAKARYVYGTSATPMRKDQLDPIIFMQCGPIRFEFSDTDGLDRQDVARVLISRFTRFSIPSHEQVGADFARLLEAVCDDIERNQLIIEDAVRLLADGHTLLILTRRVSHAQYLHGKLVDGGCSAHLLIGSDDPNTKRSKLRQLKEQPDNTPFAVITTGSYLGEGFDDNRFDALLLAAPIAWKGMVVQYAGRVHRMREGKNESMIYDYVDAHIPMFDRMYRGRLREYRNLGYEVQLGDGEDTAQSAIYSNGEFAEVFAADIANADSSVLIAAAHLTEKRIRLFMETLRGSVQHGVKVRICTADVSEDAKSRDSFIHTVSLLEESGSDVILTQERQPNLAIIDERIVWYGDINFCSFNKKDAYSLRFESASIARELMTEMI